MPQRATQEGGRADQEVGGARRRRSPYAGWEQLHRSPPRTLYHYTTARGLLSMLRSGHIWATESRYMNDPREFVHGAEVILRAIDRRLARRNTQPLRTLRARIEGHVEEKIRNMRVFFVSFCSNGDLLSQWRGYGGGGRGYAVGFNPKLLFGTAKTERPPFRVLRRIFYDPKDQDSLVEPWLRTNVDQGPEGFWRFFSEAVISFKDASYQEEGEWRLIQFGRAWDRASPHKTWSCPVEFRERNGAIVPYADLDLTRTTGAYRGRLPISEVVHGPTQDPERSGKALRLLLESCGYTEAQVSLRHSRVPYVG